MSLKVQFYKETQFKDTSIGRIPKEWEVKRLGEIVEVKRGASPRPKGDPRYFSQTNTGIHWLKISDISKYKKSIYLTFTDEFLTEEGKKRSVYIEPNTLLISNSGTVGRPIITKIPVCIHDGFLALKNLKGIIQEFLYYWFEKEITNIKKYAQQGTQANLNTNIVKNFSIPLPPLEEQKTIARILKDFDDLIEVIEEKIKTYERIKKELMKHYFSKGVFEHKEFKDTPIGRIPKEWEVRRLGGEVCEINPNYKLEKGKLYKFLPMEGVSESSYKVNFYSYRYWSGSGVRYAYGDVLLARITPSAENGKTALVDSLEKNEYGIGSTEFIVFKPKKAYSLFVYYLLKWKKIRNKLISQMTGTTGRQRIPNNAPFKVFVPLPPLEEQKEIAKRLKAIDDQIENLKEQKEHLQRIKKFFMENLLSGKVRVKSHEE